MSERTIGVYPRNRYRFRANDDYRRPWSFLPYGVAAVIAHQLTYLDFHEWLMDNLRHATARSPDADHWKPIFSTVSEGFYKTDLLLYASICEAALHWVLHRVYTHQKDSAHQAVKDCFLRMRKDFHPLSTSEVSLELPKGTIRGQLCLRFTGKRALSSSGTTFANLIHAGEAARVYGRTVRRALDRLRDDRNAIHLARNIERDSQHRAFERSDRATAKKTTEDLRVALRKFVGERPWRRVW